MAKKPSYDQDDAPAATEAPAPAQDTAWEEPKHPDPEGKMISYAPGYGPGPNGPAEIEKDK